MPSMWRTSRSGSANPTIETEQVLEGANAAKAATTTTKTNHRKKIQFSIMSLLKVGRRDRPKPKETTTTTTTPNRAGRGQFPPRISSPNDPPPTPLLQLATNGNDRCGSTLFASPTPTKLAAPAELDSDRLDSVMVGLVAPGTTVDGRDSAGSDAAIPCADASHDQGTPGIQGTQGLYFVLSRARGNTSLASSDYSAVFCPAPPVPDLTPIVSYSIQTIVVVLLASLLPLISMLTAMRWSQTSLSVVWSRLND